MSATCVWQRTSFSRVSAMKPSTIRLLSLVECSSRQAHEQWKLVRIRPVGDTKDAVQLDRRTVDSRTFSSHSDEMCTPYLWEICCVGGLSKVHMPSSAYALHAANVTKADRTDSLSWRISASDGSRPRKQGAEAGDYASALAFEQQQGGSFRRLD